MYDSIDIKIENMDKSINHMGILGETYDMCISIDIQILTKVTSLGPNTHTHTNPLR